METWEVIKALSENPKRQFKTSLGGIITTCEKTKQIIWLENDTTIESPFIIFNHALGCNNIDIEWEEIKDPVDFITAVNSNSRIKYEGWNEYIPMHEALYVLSDKVYSTAKQMINGKWYIEE